MEDMCSFFFNLLNYFRFSMISFTTDGFDNVVISPCNMRILLMKEWQLNHWKKITRSWNSPAATFLKILLMIFPDLVLGNAEHIYFFFVNLIAILYRRKVLVFSKSWIGSNDLQQKESKFIFTWSFSGTANPEIFNLTVAQSSLINCSFSWSLSNEPASLRTT